VVRRGRRWTTPGQRDAITLVAGSSSHSSLAVAERLIPAGRHLVEILLPSAAGSDGETAFDQVMAELTDAFGGVTAFTRSPAEGLWNGQGRTERDDIVIVEVMVDAVDTAWWASYRRDMERRFHQNEIIVRSYAVQLL
jgi:hypothetical protein